VCSALERRLAGVIAGSLRPDRSAASRRTLRQSRQRGTCTSSDLTEFMQSLHATKPGHPRTEQHEVPSHAAGSPTVYAKASKHFYT